MKNEALAAERARKAVAPIVDPAVPTVPEAAPAPKPVVDNDTDRRRQEEVAKLATTRTKITIKVAAAKDDYAKVAPYRSEKEGFESHLAEIDRQWETVEGVQNPKTLAEAEKTLAAVTEAADAIAFELNWLATNRDGRDAAKRIEKEIADQLEPKLREFKADDVAKSKFDKGQGERKSASSALARGEFASARRQYETAKATLSAALADARQFHIKTALAVANEYKSAAQWQECSDELTKVLGWEPENAEALALKREVGSRLKPTLRIVAKIGDREVPATATLDGKPYTSPWRWEKNLKVGSHIPNTDVSVEYTEGDKWYIGTINPVAVDWKGPRTVTVALLEYKGPRPGDTQTITLPGGVPMTFCWCPATTSYSWKRISGGNDYFLMGSPEGELGRFDGEDRHPVKLTKGFWIAQTPVTQRQYEAVTGTNPTSYGKGPDNPVTDVTWIDCGTFCRQLAAIQRDGSLFALPTEAQWEYACRAGTTTALNNGKDLTTVDGVCPNLDEVAYHLKKIGADKYPVKSKQGNAWNLYDMHGNVMEWCADDYGRYGEGLQVDPIRMSEASSRVYRGGSYNSSAQFCRSACRCGLTEGNKCCFLGFRPTRILPNQF